MKAEINMINVEDGDAIILMLEKENEKALILIDGGYKQFYHRLKKRLNQLLPHYNNKIDLVVCTHYDNDHLGGLEKVLDDYHEIIEEVWIHKANKPLTDHLNLLNEELNSIKRNNQCVNRFFKLLNYQGVQNQQLIEGYWDLIRVTKKLLDFGLEGKTIEPTTGQHLNRFEEFKVVSPSMTFYNSYLNELRGEIYYNDLRNNLLESKKNVSNYSDFLGIRKIIDLISPCEKLEKSSIKNGVTPTNLVSIVTLLQIEGKKYLFTGDAGIETFTQQNLLNEELKDLEWLDIPHHGSKNNTSEKMLFHFNPKIVFISACGESNRPHYLIVKCLESKRTRNNIQITNTPENTWYIKYDTNGNFERLLI